MLTPKNFYKLSFIVAIVGSLTACGPIYQTQHSYAPPKSSHGMMCIANCNLARNNCEQLVEMKLENCQHRAEMDYQLCLNRKDKREGTFCSREYCYKSSGYCDEQFNACYQSCGGTVTTTHVCTAFCN